MDIWHELAVAFCLMMVLEGIVPFIAPQRWRSMVEVIAKVDNRSMRRMGLISMLIGTGILYIIN